MFGIWHLSPYSLRKNLQAYPNKNDSSRQELFLLDQIQFSAIVEPRVLIKLMTQFKVLENKIDWHSFSKRVAVARIWHYMMTSSNGHIFRVTGPLCGELRGIHRGPVNSPHKGQWRGSLMFSLICAWINGWVNNGEAGDLRRNLTHYDVTVMTRVSLYHDRYFRTDLGKVRVGQYI